MVGHYTLALPPHLPSDGKTTPMLSTKRGKSIQGDKISFPRSFTHYFLAMDINATFNSPSEKLATIWIMNSCSKFCIVLEAFWLHK